MAGAVFSKALLAALPEPSILHLDWQLIVETAIQVVNVLAIIIILYLVLYKPLHNFMRSRDERIQNHLDNAVQEEANAVKLREEYAQKLGLIDDEREEILKKSRELAVTRSDEIIAEARREAASIYRRNMDELRMEQQNQRDDMKRAIIDISTRLAGRFVQISIDQKTQDEYVEKSLEHLEDSLWYE